MRFIHTDWVSEREKRELWRKEVGTIKVTTLIIVDDLAVEGNRNATAGTFTVFLIFLLPLHCKA